MTPDLNQLRRDLGLPRQQPSRTRVADPPPHEPEPSGIALNSLGGWLLAILGMALGVWLLSEPIWMLLAWTWKTVCAIIVFIFHGIMMIVIGFCVLWFFGCVLSD